MNPYLAFAATIAAGLHGIEHGLEPPPRFDGNAYAAPTLERVPSSLAEATDAFARSKVAVDAFGADVHDHLLNTAAPGVGALQPRRHRLGTPPQLRPMVSRWTPVLIAHHRPSGRGRQGRPVRRGRRRVRLPRGGRARRRRCPC